MRFIHSLAALAIVSVSMPAFASDTTQAVAGAAGAAAGAAVATAVVKGPDGATFNCSALDVSNMSDSDIINVRRACDAAKSSAPVKEAVTPDKVREWASLAKEFGSAVGQAAKELGIAVNDFLRTPAGVLLTLYLFWSKLGGIFIGIPFVILIWTMYYKIWDRMRRRPSKVENRPIFFGIFNRQIVTEYEYPRDSEGNTFAVVGGLVVTAITGIIIATIIL